jgi:hypothetical protein
MDVHGIRSRRRLIAWLSGGSVLAITGWVAYAIVAWLRFGRVARGAEGTADELLDRFIPEYDLAIHHQARVGAPAEVVLAAVRDLDLGRSPLVRAILAARGLPARLHGDDGDVPFQRGLLTVMASWGWVVLAETPAREIIVGTVTQPWKPAPGVRPPPSGEFAAFAEPGYAKIVTALAAEPLGPAEAVCRVETRVRMTDARSRERFRRYWAIVSPGSLVIRRLALRLVRCEAERLHAAAVTTRTSSPVAPAANISAASSDNSA